MMRIRRKVLAAGSALGLFCAGALLVNVDASLARADSVKGSGYIPGLGDLMNSSMQVHHTKLWFAGRAGNWGLATFELKELKETIDDIQTFSPEWKGMPVAAMVTSLNPSIDSIAHAIKSKDFPAFEASYRKLSAACSECHAAANHPEIKIIVPLPEDSHKFVDQDFKAGGAQQY